MNRTYHRSPFLLKSSASTNAEEEGYDKQYHPGGDARVVVVVDRGVGGI